MKLDILDILRRDDLQQQEQTKADGAEKSEHLRAGNSGIMLPDGNIAGTCHRKAFLRLKGVDIEPDANRLIMFEFGRQNETIIIEKLKRVLGDTFTITGDDTNTIEWQLASGRTVSGRPDIIISSKNGEALLLLEMKMVSSLWTARDVVFGNSPKLGHVIQTTHYAGKKDCPAKVVYIQPVDFQTPMWSSTVDMFPKPGEKLSELVEYTEKEVSEGRGKGAVKKLTKIPKKVLPSRTVYDLKLDSDGYVSYRNETSKSGWTDTPVSMDAIEKFYEYVDQMEVGGLGPRPLSLKACGDFENYTQCQYCELSGLCDRFEQMPDRWFEEVERSVRNGTLKK